VFPTLSSVQHPIPLVQRCAAEYTLWKLLSRLEFVGRIGEPNQAGDTMVVRILIADDHEIVRRGLRALLETRTDFLVCGEAQDGREAVELALEHKPDIAIIDVSLPTLNGIEATRQIRRGSPLTEVVVLTMHESEELIAEALHAGARGYLIKSEADEQILNAVGSLARHRPFFSSHVSETLLDKFNSGTAGHPSGLTGREREIVQLISEGNSNKMIARTLDISVKTVETHRSTSMRKLSLRSTAELVRYALRNKLVQA
jgi:DNA-binding NarL/FixJ family response regulator